MSALQWRTVSSTGTPTSARFPHLARPASRRAVRVQASIVNPHSILGVSPTADVKEVKRAYRKLALQYHPDVCKSEDGHERFMALTQAYELLLGRAEGKTDPNHASATGWDFHDWYWNFRMHRSWEKQQRQAKAAAKATAAARASESQAGAGEGADSPQPDSDDDVEDGEPDCGRQAPPHGHAGYKAPEGRDNLRSQLAGLRHRAAVRAKKRSPPSAGSSPACSAPSAASTGTATSPSSCGAAPVTSSAPWSAASGGPLGEDAARSGAAPSSPLWSWSWSWDETLGQSSDDEQAPTATSATAAASAAGSRTVAEQSAAAAGLHHQYTHVYDREGGVGRMAVQDGHLGTVVANHAVPFPGGLAVASGAGGPATAAAPAGRSPQAPAQVPDDQLQQQGQHNTHTDQHQHDHDVTAVAGHDGDFLEPEPFSNPYGQAPPHQRQGYAQARRQFHADSATRESVSHQLTGLRRKAAIKAQWVVAGSGSSDAGL